MALDEFPKSNYKETGKSSDALAEQMIQNMPAYICTLEGKDFRIKLANNRFKGLFKLHDIDHIGKPLTDVLPEMKGQKPVTLLQKAFETGKPVEESEVPIRFFFDDESEKTTRYFNLTFVPVSNGKDESRELLTMGVDVTEQVFARKAVEEVKERFEYAFKASDDLLYDHDISGDRITLSENFQNIFGYTFSDEPFTVEKWASLLHPDDKESISESAESFLADKKKVRWQAEYRFARKDGTYASVKENGYVIRDKAGNPIRMIGVVQDISEQKNNEIKKEISAKISHIFNESETMGEALEGTLYVVKALGEFQLAELWLTDGDRDKINLAAYIKDEISGFYDFGQFVESFEKGEGLPGTAWKSGKIQFWKNLGTRKTFIRREQAAFVGLEAAFGFPIFYDNDVTAVLLLGTGKHLTRLQSPADVLEDLASQLGEEIQRKKLEEELSRIYMSAPDGIIVAGFDGYFKKVNPAMCEMLGYSREELLSRQYFEFIHPDDREITAEIYEQVNLGAEKTKFGNRYIAKTGAVVWLSWTMKIFHKEKIAYLVAKDVTAQKELEDRFIQSNRLAKIGSWDMNLISGEHYWSDITREIHEVDADFKPDLEKAYAFYKAGESRGKIESAVSQAIKKGTGWDLEVQIITAKGKERWVRAIGKSEMVDGQCVRLYGSFQDIDDRKVADEELRVKSRHLEAISHLKSALLDYSDWYNALGENLHVIGDAVQSDRVYYFENDFDPHTGEGYSSQKLEWCRDGITSQLGNPELKKVPFAVAPELISPLLTRKPSFALISEVPEGSNTRKMLEKQDIKSFLILPVYVDDRFHGLMGFDNCSSERYWSNEERETLETITASLATAISRQQQDEKLQKLLVEKNTILESISDAFYALDKEWKFTYFNSEAERLLEKTAEEVIGNKIWDVFAPAADTELFEIYNQVVRQKKARTFEYNYPPQNAWYDIAAYPAESGLSVYFKNINEKKKEQKLIEQKNNQLDAIARFNGLLISEESWFSALQQSFEMFGNIAGADRVYYFENNLDASGKPVTITMRLEWTRDSIEAQASNPDNTDLPAEAASSVAVMAKNKPYSAIVETIESETFRNILKEQSVKSVLSIPVFVEGTFHGFIGFDDCTNERVWVDEEISFLQTIAINLASAIENEEAKHDLEESFKEKNDILERIGDAFFAVDNDWTITYWNKMAESFLQKTKEEVIGQNLWDVYADAVELEFYRQYQNAVENQVTVQFEAYYPGTGNWFEVSAYPSDSGLSVFFKDITERYNAIREIELSNERFLKVSEVSEDAIWDFDAKKESLYWGEGFDTLFGYDQEEFGNELSRWAGCIHEDDRERIMNSIDELFTDKEQLIWENEYRFQKKDGRYAYIRDKGSVIRNEKGNVIRIVGAMSDVTEQKEVEEKLRSLNESLKKQAEELAKSNAELEQFAFVASHDLQEPLRMVTSFLAQLEKKYSDQLDERAHQYIHFATDGARRMRQIILDLLDYSRVGRVDTEQEHVDMNSIVDNVLALHRTKIEDMGAEVKKKPLPAVFAARGAMQQLMQNLVSNALNYHQPGSKPKIEIWHEEHKKTWRFFVKDNGIGIEPQYQEKIFNIFQRLHGRDEYSGTGVGLAICKKIVEEHGGMIGVDSKEGVGSTFYFSIPKK